MRGLLRRAEIRGTVCNAAARSGKLRIAERPPHPRSPRSSRGSLDLSPHAGRGDKEIPFSRCVFLIRTRAMSKSFPRTSPLSRPSSDRSSSGGPDQSRSGAARKNGRERKEAERRKAQRLQVPHLQGAARVQRDAHAFRRSTAALARGLFIPKAQHRPCFLRLSRSVRSCTAAPTRGAETLRFSTGVTRAAPVPVQ